VQAATTPQRVPHLTTDHHTTAYVTPQHNEQEKPTMDCLPSMLFTVTRRVSAASLTPDYTNGYLTHIPHDHRQSLQITNSQKNDYSCLPIYSDGGCEQPGETVEEIEFHEQASLQEHSVLRKPT
jgi:hypothetical protein